MEEKKKKKTIKCSYAVLVIILFAALAFVTDYAFIERKISKCDCPKCEVTNNEVISDNIENKDIKSFNECLKSDEDYCSLYDSNLKIELVKSNSNKFNSIIINKKQYDFFNDDIINNVVQTSDGNVYVEYFHNSLTNSILLDSNSSVVSTFEELYENGLNNRVYYNDGIYEVFSFKGESSPLRLCDSLLDENVAVDITKKYKYENNEFVLIERIEKSLLDYLNEEGYSSCSEVR